MNNFSIAMVIFGMGFFFIAMPIADGNATQCKLAGMTGLDFERCIHHKANGTWNPDTFERREPTESCR